MNWISSHILLTLLIVFGGMFVLAVLLDVIGVVVDDDPDADWPAKPHEWFLWNLYIAMFATVIAGAVLLGIHWHRPTSTRYGVHIDGVPGPSRSAARVITVDGVKKTCYRHRDRILCLDQTGRFVELSHN